MKEVHIDFCVVVDDGHYRRNSNMVKDEVDHVVHDAVVLWPPEVEGSKVE